MGFGLCNAPLLRCVHAQLRACVRRILTKLALFARDHYVIIHALEVNRPPLVQHYLHCQFYDVSAEHLRLFQPFEDVGLRGDVAQHFGNARPEVGGHSPVACLCLDRPATALR